MNVLHVLFHSLPINTGYSIRSNYILANLKRKIQVKAITSSYQNSSNEVEIINGVIHYRSIRQHEHIYNCMYFLRKQILQLNKEEKFDIIHVHSPWIIAIPSIFASKKLKVPIIYEVRGVWEDTDVAQGLKTSRDIKYKIIKKLETWSMRKADRIVTISKSLQQDIISRGVPKEKIVHIPNGVDTKYFSSENVSLNKINELRKKYSIKEDQLIIGYISSIRRLEGIEHLLLATKYFNDSINYKILLVGDGEYLPKLRTIAKNLGIQDKVIFTSRVNHEEILNYYKLIDIFVVPRIEARVNELVTPLKPYEALSMGKALVVSNVGGLREIIVDGETGLTFQKGNAMDLAEKVLLLAKDVQFKKKICDNARKYVSPHFDWEKVADKYLDLYKNILGENDD